MNKTIKILLPSILTLALCVSLVVGSTFALFKSEQSTNIAVTSGKVEVVATIDDFHMYTRGDDGNRIDDEWLSGEAHEQGGEITLSNMAPYDGVTFNINIVSYSTVAIKWQVQLTFEGDPELSDALTVDIGGVDLIDTQLARASNWALLTPTVNEQAVTTLSVRIELTESVKEAQGKNCSISITVYAVQGNAQTTDPVPYFFLPKHLSIFSK